MLPFSLSRMGFFGAEVLIHTANTKPKKRRKGTGKALDKYSKPIFKNDRWKFEWDVIHLPLKMNKDLFYLPESYKEEKLPAFCQCIKQSYIKKSASNRQSTKKNTLKDVQMFRKHFLRSPSDSFAVPEEESGTACAALGLQQGPGQAGCAGSGCCCPARALPQSCPGSTGRIPSLKEPGFIFLLLMK